MKKHTPPTNVPRLISSAFQTSPVAGTTWDATADTPNATEPTSGVLVRFEWTTTGAGLSKGVTVTLFIDDREVATGRIDLTMGAVGAAYLAPHPRTRESAEL